MASSYSTDLKLELMVTGEKAGLWGDITNTNLTILQQAIAGYEAVSIAGGAQTTALTFSNGATSDGKNAVIDLTGTITGNQIVTIPDGIEKTYLIKNSTSGAFTVQFKTVSGTGPTFSATDKGVKSLYSNGTDVIDTGFVSNAIAAVVDDSTPQLGGNLDANGNNILIDNGNFIGDENGAEQIKFATTASAVNEVSVTNAATGNAPSIAATGSDTNIDFNLTPKGIGRVTFNGGGKIQQIAEKATVVATSASGTINYDVLTQAVLFFNSNASGNWTLNIRGDGSNTLNSIMDIGESITVAHMVEMTTAYYNSAVQIDGSSVTPEWQGGAAPTAGNPNSIDVYSYTVIKTADAVFKVFASQTQFA
jgi:hypothetical protein